MREKKNHLYVDSGERSILLHSLVTPTKRWTALPAKHCTVCGVEYIPGSGISKYCPACAKKIQRERGVERKRRSRERKRQGFYNGLAGGKTALA
ncbi:hypothetical protein D7V96_21960 [bacterium D16-59]|nr:hypothetical protein D7V96_21960 [bacterium D16-59]